MRQCCIGKQSLFTVRIVWHTQTHCVGSIVQFLVAHTINYCLWISETLLLPDQVCVAASGLYWGVASIGFNIFIPFMNSRKRTVRAGAQSQRIPGFATLGTGQERHKSLHTNITTRDLLRIHVGDVGEWRYISTHWHQVKVSGQLHLRAVGIQWIGGWVGPSVSLDTGEQKSSCSTREPSPVPQPIVSPYTG
jgi:hypothetical protein